jgi:hypothetical protein
LASIHFLAVIATAIYIAHSNDGQAPLLWVFFGVIDLPISLLMGWATRLPRSFSIPHIGSTA